MRTAEETYDAMVRALRKSTDKEWANKRIGVYSRALAKCGKHTSRECLLIEVDKIDRAPCRGL